MSTDAEVFQPLSPLEQAFERWRMRVGLVLAPVLFVLGAGVWLLSPAENPWSWLGFLLAAAGCWVWMQHMLTPAHQPGE